MTTYEKTSLRILTSILSGISFQVASQSFRAPGVDRTRLDEQINEWLDATIDTITHAYRIINESDTDGNEGPHGLVGDNGAINDGPHGRSGNEGPHGRETDSTGVHGG